MTSTTNNNNNIPTGQSDPAGTHGPHHSAVGNAMDPRVDSDRDGRGFGRDGTTTGTRSGVSQSHNPVNPHSGSGGGIFESVKGRIAQVHGIGESTRGHFNSTVNGLMHDKEGQRKDAAVAAGGEREFANKEFERHGTMDKAL